MSGVEAFFRHCPFCGRRFEIRLVSKSESEAGGEYTGGRAVPAVPVALGAKDSNTAFGPIQLTQGSPTIVSVSEVEETRLKRYSYKCRHCGHEWSEERYKVGMREPAERYTGD